LYGHFLDTRLKTALSTPTILPILHLEVPIRHIVSYHQLLLLFRKKYVKMSRNLSVVEPHPSIPKNGAFVYGGRGGAGNFKRYRSEDLTSGPTASGPASRISLTKGFKRQTSQPTGRGGAGNMFKSTADDERVFQFDEEMMKKREMQAPVYHIGRGGAANYVDESKQQPRTERMNSTTSALSSSSEDSTNGNAKKSEGTFSKLARRFS
jgi:hypothetical protein